MERFETTASKAETEIYKLLSANGQVYRPWQFAGYDLQTRTLKTSSDEVMLLLEREAYLRPGFKAEGNTAFIPNLFVKLSGPGDYKCLSGEPDANNEGAGGSRLFFRSVRDFGSITGSCSDISEIPELLDENGLVDHHKLMESGIYRYRFLRIEYQKIVVDKINYIVEHRKELFLSQIDTANVNRIISVLLNLDENLMTLFNSFDFQYRPPAVIIENNDKSSFTDDKAYILVLLNLLGFDIIIYSAQSFADIENVLSRDLFDIFYSNGADLQTEPPEKSGIRNYVQRHVALSVLLALSAVAVISFLIIGIYFPDITGIEQPGTGSGPTGLISETTDSLRTSAKPEEENFLQSEETEAPETGDTEASETGEAEAPETGEAAIAETDDAEGLVAGYFEKPDDGNVEMPEAVKAVIPKDTKTETFNASDYVPDFKGTITKVHLPAENVDPNADDVHINWIKPVNGLKADEEAFVMIEVEYSLVNEDGANLAICYNNNADHTGYQMENSRFRVSRGTGMCIFHIPVTPKRWDDGTPFQISSSLNHFEDPDPRKHNATLAGAVPIPLEIK